MRYRMVFQAHNTSQEITLKWPPIGGFVSSDNSQCPPSNGRMGGLMMSGIQTFFILRKLFGSASPNCYG